MAACGSCGSANEADARFCESCGNPLQRSCGACGVVASATARFCRSCGASLNDQGAQEVASPTRKTVTVMFADLAGSTAFEELVDPETAREVIGQYHELLRSTAQRHRAGVTKYIGDGFMAVWGVPEIGAGDAGHAVDAAVELQERFVGLAGRLSDAHGVDLALRVAVNTGEVVVGTEDADLVGDALNVAARLESECPHGHVVVGEETWRATRGQHRYDPLGAVQVKGRSAAVPVYQWVGRADAAESVPFVGRSPELGRLQAVFDAVATARTARLVTVIGDPGVGKTRLAAEFIGALGDGVQVIRAHCAVEGSPALAPLVDVLRTRDLDDDISATIAERDRILRDLTGMTAGVAGSVEEAFWALRRYVEILATHRPLVLLVDDIQWADTLLLDFVEHLVEWVRDAPVLLIALARPELRETRPDLVTVSGWVAEALRLRGLDADATAELAARVLGSDQLPEELLARLPSSTGGNPLFVRELVGMLVHDGVLIAKPGGWSLTVDVDAVSVPPTIHALLASRLERLGSTNRRVLEVASVIGTDFSPSAVAALAGVGVAEIMSGLNRLRRLDLAQPSGAYAGDEPVWRFHHVLIRDVAYRRLLKAERAELHERLANWVHAGGPSAAFESDEVIARNLEAAHGYRCELGLRDGHTSELALRSARNYLASARRALDRDELGSAGSQAARGASLATADAALHAELLMTGCEALLSAGDVAAGAPLVDDLESVAGLDLTPWATCYRCQLLVYTDPTRLLEVDQRLQAAIDEFEGRNDAVGLAKAHRVRASARARLGRIGDCESDLFEALIAARRGGDHRQITAALGAAPNAALWGPSPAPKAGGRCLDVVRMQRMTTATPSLEATSLRCLAVLELLRGRPDKARTMLADARQIVADLGLRHGLMETELFAGIIELMAGDAVAAEPHFQVALEGLDALGVGADAGQAAALLARSVLAQGRVDEADRYAGESERIAGHNLKTAIAWRSVRAEILSASGEDDQAVAMARGAVTVAEGTDLVLDHADACLALSRVLTAAGDERGAADARRDAEVLYAVKDAVFMVARTADPAASGASIGSGAQTPPRPVTANRASRIVDLARQAMTAGDPDAVVAFYSDQMVYDDRRRLSGDPINSVEELRTAAQRMINHYHHVESRTVGVRGDSLVLYLDTWSDDFGNRTTTFNLFEVRSDDLVSYHGRFDENDGDEAEQELDKRYAAGEGLEKPAPSRLVLANRASAVGDRMIAAMQAHDVDGTIATWSDQFVYNDQRRLGGSPLEDVAALRAAIERICVQYSHFEAHNLAFRGDNVYMGWTCWSDDAGNESRYIGVYEVNADGLVCYHSRFDEDEFWPAYRDMETRYYMGEGAQFAINGLPAAEWVIGISQGDIDAVRRVSDPEFRWHAPPSALKEKVRSVDEMFRWTRARGSQVSSQRHWVPALVWLSPTCNVGLGEIEGVGPDGEEYRWNLLFVCECRDGLLVSTTEFDTTDEDAAFAYAASLVAARPHRFAVTNRASQISDRLATALESGDIVAAGALFSAKVEYDDRRGLFGELSRIVGSTSIRKTIEGLRGQFTRFDLRTLAVRGGQLSLAQFRWFDDAGNQSTGLAVGEIDDNDLVCYQGYFDEDDFDGAYSELERRYFASLGPSRAALREPLTELVLAENRGDLDSTFRIFAPGLQIESRSRSVFPRRTVAELRQSVESLSAMVESYRVWGSAMCWVSDDVFVSRHEREAIGLDGQPFTWSRLYAARMQNGLFTALCEFDVTDEDAAFAYAEELARTGSSGLALANRATEAAVSVAQAAEAREFDALSALYSDEFHYDDRRQLSGDPIVGSSGLRAAFERLRAQYTRFSLRILAVRGDNVHLGQTTWSDEDGNEAINLAVGEVDDDGRAKYHAVFEEDDFAGAYRELERRYYAGEGAAAAHSGLTNADYVAALNRADFDTIFTELSWPDLQIENRSRSGFPDRSAAELRASLIELQKMVPSLRSWFSSIRWLAPDLFVGRMDREGLGHDGEHFTWARILVGVYREGRLARLCDFDADDEDAAFVYAHELL
ncbi:nuclear transport factor 2 family protein [Mycolicibacterium sp. BK634]|uniref:nuclear transport factor 2 family protein n=1 Tax=Mycolicibacterium sp. BK634 TaxID=2587099 RepID=UPI001614B930|nr:nuclear transport factor 2 family protein [Mycolicibacterium sp. BK634]